MSSSLPDEAAWLCGEAAQVIGLRLALLLRGGPAARRELGVMTAEKYAAACILTARLVTGGLGTSPGEVAHRTVRFHRRWVRANRRRLLRG